MAQMLAFPLARRVDFVERHARMIAGMSRLLGEEHLAGSSTFKGKLWRGRASHRIGSRPNSKPLRAQFAPRCGAISSRRAAAHDLES